MSTSRFFRHLTQALLVAALCGGLAAPASAELLPAEMTSVQKVIEAGNGDAQTLQGAVAAQLDLILQSQTNANTREPIKNLKHLVRQARFDVNIAALHLLGAEMPPYGQPRQYYVNVAAGLISKTLTSTIPAINTAADAVKAAGAPGVYPWTIDRFKSIGIAGARAKLLLYNPTLAYADPLPPGRSKVCPAPPSTDPCVPGDRVTIIGPHGDYVLAARWLATAIDRMNRLQVADIDGYGADALLSSYAPTYQREKFIHLLLTKIMFTAGTFSGMRFGVDSTDAFFRILGRLEDNTHGGGGPTTAANDCNPDRCHGASYDFNNITLAMSQDSSQWPTRPTLYSKMLVIMRELTESWQALDTGGVWYALKFPQCERLGGCGGT